MTYIEEIKPAKVTYVYLRKNYRKGNKVLNKKIYLGNRSTALKILNELISKPLQDEREITHSGEMVLSKIADSVSFESILKKFSGDDKTSRIVKNTTILRTLFPESKRRLFLRRLKNSILKEETDISYVKQIYRSMDKIYDNLGLILYEMVKKAVRRYEINLNQLIIDGTRLKVFTDKETGLVKFGYSNRYGKKLPQINLILAVNNQQIPLFTETYPGNENDISMFTDFIKHLKHKYRFLTKRVKKKTVVFDQGNVGKATIKAVDEFRKDDIYFVSLMRTNSISKYIKQVDKNEMKLIYERKISKNKKSRVFGIQLKDDVYGIKSNIVLCYNPDIAKKKLKTLNTKIRTVKDLVEELNKKNSDIDAKLDEVKVLIKKYNFKTLIEPKRTKDKIAFKIVKKELKKRRMRCGFFSLFTNDLELMSEETVKVYKSKDLVEKSFRELKSDVWIEPIFHHEDHMKEIHTIMVIYGYFLASLLRSILKEDYSFEELISIIKSGNAIEGYYENDLLPGKKLRIFRPIKQSDELRSIFRQLKIKVPKYEIRNLMATD